MAKRSTAEASKAEAEVQADPFAHILNDMRTEIGFIFTGVEQSAVCEHGALLRGVKIAPVAREIGVPQITLTKYVLGDAGVGTKTLGKFVNWLTGRKAARAVDPEQAEALAEAASL